MVQHHINKGMCTVSEVFPLFCQTPVVHADVQLRDLTFLYTKFLFQRFKVVIQKWVQFHYTEYLKNLFFMSSKVLKRMG
jgi:hypothetical protein